ncbi:MAG: hypothetical protein QF515_01600 [Pseudomonadales bacterium]|nr:hypothetical protein [Pseudomonadales bacterium]
MLNPNNLNNPWRVAVAFSARFSGDGASWAKDGNANAVNATTKTELSALVLILNIPFT